MKLSEREMGGSQIKQTTGKMTTKINANRETEEEEKGTFYRQLPMERCLCIIYDITSSLLLKEGELP